MKRRVLSGVLVVWLALLGVAASARENFSAVDIVPAPKAVTLDGDLREWDQSGFVETCYDPSLYPNFSLHLGFMYDAKALYIGAHVVDATPLVNAIDPAVNPTEGWMGDCLQVRLISDPAAPFPYPAGKDANARICHLTMWYCTPKGQPALCQEYGMDYHGMQTFTGAESGLAFKKDADGKGYTLEARIPWERLHTAAPKAGDTITLTAQPLWGNDTGTANTVNFYEITSQRGFAYQSAAGWGRATFAAKGHVTPRVNPALAAGGDATGKPLQLHLKLDDAGATSVSLGLFSPERALIRTLPVTERRVGHTGADFTLAWDGLDDDGKPIPPGTYQLKTLTSRNIGQQFVASLHQSGNPPWKTDDGTGAWGGDWAPPVAAAAAGDKVYLAWGCCEAGPGLVCVQKELDAHGVYRKVWGAFPALHNEAGFIVTAIATDGDHLFVAQDGLAYGRRTGQANAAITVYDAHTGRPQNFPFGASVLAVAQWDSTRFAAEAATPLFERRKTGNFGPVQQGMNLTALAVQGDTVYAALFADNAVTAFNWKTGAKLKTYPVNAPSGIAIAADGALLVAAEKGIQRIDPASGATTLLAPCTRPWGVTVDKTGAIYAADDGTTMQVKVFKADGTPLRTVGKAGGRAWIGTYDATGMLMPAGIAVDADGKLWVTEYDEFPRRVSVWDAAGKAVGDFHGPCVPQTDRGLDPAHPNRINAQMVEYEVDYATGQTKCLTTLWRPHLDGWTPVSFFGRASRMILRTYKGQQYGFLDHGYSDRLGVIFIRKGDRLQACASIGFGTGVPIYIDGGEEGTYGRIPHPETWFTPEQQKALGKPDGLYQVWHTWTDLNDDGIVQPEELHVERREYSDHTGACTFTGVDDDLTLWGQGFGNADVYRIPVDHFTEHGVPVYTPRQGLKPLFSKLSAPDASFFMDAKHGRVYGFDTEGGDSRMRGKWAAVSCYDFAGKLQWLYRPTWMGFALDSPFWKPGYVIGVGKVIGEADLDNGVGLIALPGYYGNYHLLSTDGLWVHACCQDNRLGGGATANTQFIENMTGNFFRNKDNGKVYLVGGDVDARVWEVTGLDTIRTAVVPLTITAAEFQAASIAATKAVPPVALAPLQLAKAGKITIDGALTDWKLDHAARIDAGPGRGASVSLAADDANLYAAFQVDDRSPLVNTATDAPLLFKGGDTCEVMLGTAAGGDTRLLFSVLDGKPVCMLYQPVSAVKAPKTFTSPTGSVAFDRVQPLDDVQLAVQRTDKGYVLEARVPWHDLGFGPEPGATLRGDVGVLFGTDGGGRTILRAYYANKDTAIVEDVPTEARLAPTKWTTVEVAQ